MSWIRRSSVGILAIAACALPPGAGRSLAAGGGPALVVGWNGDLYAIAVDGSRVRLTRTRADETQPAVSSDGSTIAYVRESTGSFSGLWTMRIDGSRRRILTRRGDERPTWAPDGSAIYFTRYGAARGRPYCAEIFHMSPTGTEVHRVPIRSGGAAQQDPAVSPDGQRIAFTDWDMCDGGTSSPRLRVVDTRGRPASDLARLGHNGWFPDPEHSCPAWSPDGRQLAFRRDADLAVADRDGSHERRILRGGRSLVYERPAWSPDGRWIAFSTYGGLFVVHPDGTGRRRLGPPASMGGWLPSLPR